MKHQKCILCDNHTDYWNWPYCGVSNSRSAGMKGTQHGDRIISDEECARRKAEFERTGFPRRPEKPLTYSC